MPIQSKLKRVSLLISALAFLAISSFMMVKEWIEWRHHAVTDLRLYAHVIGNNIIPSLLHQNTEPAERFLAAALLANPTVVHAVVYDQNRKLFASYKSPSHLHDDLPYPGSKAERMPLSELIVSQPIEHDGKQLGRIVLEANTGELYQAMSLDAAVTILTAMGLFLANFLLFSRLMKVITNPLLDLSREMQTIAVEQNYAVRVPDHGGDETGMLARTFNEMIERIQLRDSELKRYRDHLEEEVFERTARLTEAQRIAHLGNWSWDIVNNRVDWSDEIYRIFGIDRGQFGASYEAFLQTVHPEDRQLVERQVVQSLENRQPYDLIHRILLPDNTVRYVHEQAEVTLGADGKPMLLIGTVHDITDSKLAEEALRKANVEFSLFRTLLDNSADAVEVVDPATLKILDVNETSCRELGFSREALLSMSIYDIDPSSPEVHDSIREQLEQSQGMRFESLHKRKDGSTFPVEVSSKLVRLDKPYVLNIVRDISERKLAEKALAESELKFRTILETAVDGILVVDAESRQFILGNQAISEMLGYRQDEINQLNVSDIHPQDSLPAIQRQFEKQLKGEIRIAQNLPVKRKDGSIFYCDISSSPMTLSGKSYLVGVFHDVTERMQAEARINQLNDELEEKIAKRTRELVAAQEELVRKEKLAVLGQVAGSVGHELRNPLGVISNAVYFLQTVLTDADETTKQYLNIISDEVAASGRIVNDLLDAVRTKPPRPELVEVAQLVTQVLQRYAIPSSVTLSLEIPETLPPLRVDSMQISQVLRNLVCNAVESMAQGGTLRIMALQNGGSIAISVCDSGTGISPESLPKLFQPLFTTKERGIGLGLVVVKNLTQANGGTIDVQSRIGQGSTFTVTLPAANPLDIDNTRLKEIA